MAYTDHLQIADNYINHTKTIVAGINDPVLAQRYIGFVAITAVTAYELAIKEILVDFAKRKHKVFGVVIENLYQRINGRITLGDLEDTHVKRFGEKYLSRFKKKISAQEKRYLKASGRSIRSSYGNVVTWRHIFIHQGQVPSNANFIEAVRAFGDGKEVVHVLASTMNR